LARCREHRDVDSRNFGLPRVRKPKILIRTLLVVGALAALAAPKLWSSGAFGRLATQESAASATPSGAAEPAPPRPRGAAPIRVTAETVQAGSLSEVVTSTGTLLAAESVELQAEVNGKITAIEFVEGSRVRKGDLLVKLNDADLQARRLAASHEVALAERREKRIAELLKQGFVIPDDHDEALNTVNVRRAEIELTDAQIAKTEIRAPFDGIAGLRYVSEGSFVNAASKIATLQRVDTLKVDFAVPEKYADRIRAGNPITFTVAGRSETFDGKVYAYDPRIDSETRTLLIRALCPNPGEVLLPGAFAHVELTLNEIVDALMVPAEAVIPDFEAAFVFVVKDGKAERRKVVTGVRTEDRVQVLAGLEAGEVVVTSGLMQLRQGSPVEADLDTTRASLVHR
jgi:membrane fusion protein (multidrug efflux system)